MYVDILVPIEQVVPTEDEEEEKEEDKKNANGCIYLGRCSIATYQNTQEVKMNAI